jgi:UDP-GlcNAc:undecaprenyl-phosphate GlcNAc-1-phosphate transferase
MEALTSIFKTYQCFGWIAFITAVFLTPLAMRAAHRFGVLDMPDQKLKPHTRPIPYLGGAAICVAWAVTLIAAMVSRVVPNWHVLLPMLLGGVAMSVLGLVDDVRHVSPKLRLAAGTAVIAATIIATGTGFQLVGSILTGISAVFPGLAVELPPAVTVSLSVVLSVFIVLGACNSTNLIDGLDGLCSGVTGLISVGFFLLASHLAAAGYSAGGDPVRLVLAIAMFGAALGFLPWNFNPARIFMGDAGSVLLGYNCGMLILLFAERGKLRWVIGALMIFALPVFDTALAMLRRWRAGRSIFEGDRSHFYDQLVQRRFSVRQTVLICYALTVIYGALGLLMTWVRPGVEAGSSSPVIRTRYAVPLYAGVCLLTACLAWKAGLTRPEEPELRARTPRGGD